MLYRMLAPFYRQGKPDSERLRSSSSSRDAHVPGSGSDCRALSILVLPKYSCCRDCSQEPISTQKLSTPRSCTAEMRRWPHCALLSVHRAAKASQIGAGVTTRAFFQLFDHHGREQKCLVRILTPSVYIYLRSFAWMKRNRFRLGPWMLPSNPHLYCVKLADSQGDFLLGDKGKG